MIIMMSHHIHPILQLPVIHYLDKLFLISDIRVLRYVSGRHRFRLTAVILGGWFDVGVREVVREGEIELGTRPTEAKGGAVIGPGGILGGVERAKPHALGAVGIPDLGRPLPPWPLPHSPVLVLLVLPPRLRRAGC